MGDRRRGAAKLHSTFWTQAKALSRKNLLQQRRAWKTNIFIVVAPLFFCALLLVLQRVLNNAFNTPENRCGCYCLRCCRWRNGRYSCGANSPDNPCQSWETCDLYDENRCGLEYSTSRQAVFCGVASPSSWPAMLQVPRYHLRAKPWAPSAAFLYTGANESVASGIASGLFEQVPTVAELTQRLPDVSAYLQKGNETGALYVSAVSKAGLALGSWQRRQFRTLLVEPTFLRSGSYNATLFLMGPSYDDPEVRSVAALLNSYVRSTLAGQSQNLPTVELAGARTVWLPSSDAVNRQLYCGYRQARCNGTLQLWEYAQAYDFQDSTDKGRFNVRMWYNATGRFGTSDSSVFRGVPPEIIRVNQGIHKASNAWLRWALGSNNATSTLIGMMDFPKSASRLRIDIGILLGPLFLSWLCQLLLPFMISVLVYEKEQRLRSMMKMHGLGDAAYWAIQYTWFFALNFVYIWLLIGFGSAVGLNFFTKTSYSFQLVFYFLWINCLTGFTFLLSTLFRSSKTAVVAVVMYVFGTGLLGLLLLEQFISRNHWWLVFLELIPGFGLYRGLYEIAQYAFRAVYQSGTGMTWSSLDDPGNGTLWVMVIFAAEWVVFMLLAWYLEQVLDTGIGVPKHPLFFLGRKYRSSTAQHLEAAKQRGQGAPEGAEVLQVESDDAARERQRVAALLADGVSPFEARAPLPSRVPSSASILKQSPSQGDDSADDSLALKPSPASSSNGRGGGGGGGGASPPWRLASGPGAASSHTLCGSAGCSIVIQDLWKVFPPTGGNPEKAAVRGLTLAIDRGECFGLLGPNGAGKSTSINMLTGFLEPTAGLALVEGFDIRNQMDSIHGIMGVCPQDNLLWETLTGREHLEFYGRLKNLKGADLAAAVERGLRSVNLFNGGVGNKKVGTYSGGMKRRLSVAISLIGDPLVVYLDEPSTGLDPASRHSLWDVVKHAKQDRGIILTTHSMEEAAVLCDRLGIFVDGELICIGGPKELTARHCKYYVFTVTVPQTQEAAADELVRQLAPGARLTYALAGTRKYELPADQVSLSDIFDAMEGAKGRGLEVLDWGVANATLEEVFIKFARSLGVEGGQ